MNEEQYFFYIFSNSGESPVCTSQLGPCDFPQRWRGWPIVAEIEPSLSTLSALTVCNTPLSNSHNNYAGSSLNYSLSDPESLPQSPSPRSPPPPPSPLECELPRLVAFGALICTPLPGACCTFCTLTGSFDPGSTFLFTAPANNFSWEDRGFSTDLRA